VLQNSGAWLLEPALRAWHFYPRHHLSQHIDASPDRHKQQLHLEGISMRLLIISFTLLSLSCSHPLTAVSGPKPAPMAAVKNVVFIHGMFMTPLCWEEWQRVFAEHGYTTSAPPWPEHSAPPAAQRAMQPNAALGKVTLEEVVQMYADILGKMEPKPVLVGHSMGGLIVQLLLQRGLGSAGIVIDSAPPQGIISLKWSFLKSNWGVISPSANKDEPFLPTRSDFQYAFGNSLSETELRAAYDKLVVPESRRVGNGPTGDVAKIDFSKSRPPLLILAGEDDHIIPASLNWDNFKAYAKTPAFTEFHAFAGRTHFTLGQAGWQDVADASLAWLDGLTAQR
jgi:pimeloyl-ACP methyl ester carboxylesterase